MEATLTLRQIKNIEDYKRLDEGTPVQLIRGEFIMSPSPLTRHQRALMRLSYALLQHVNARTLGEVFVAPLDVFVSQEDVYQPDVFFIAREHAHYIEEDGVHGPPDIAIEILSKRTAGFDLLLKKDGYEKFGVKEYWVVDPMDKTIEVFINSKNGFESAFAGKTGTACSSVLPEFCVDVLGLFATK